MPSCFILQLPQSQFHEHLSALSTFPIDAEPKPQPPTTDSTDSTDSQFRPDLPPSRFSDSTFASNQTTGTQTLLGGDTEEQQFGDSEEERKKLRPLVIDSHLEETKKEEIIPPVQLTPLDGGHSWASETIRAMDDPESSGGVVASQDEVVTPRKLQKRSEELPSPATFVYVEPTPTTSDSGPPATLPHSPRQRDLLAQSTTSQRSHHHHHRSEERSPSRVYFNPNDPQQLRSGTPPNHPAHSPASSIRSTARLASPAVILNPGSPSSLRAAESARGPSSGDSGSVGSGTGTVHYSPHLKIATRKDSISGHTKLVKEGAEEARRRRRSKSVGMGTGMGAATGTGTGVDRSPTGRSEGEEIWKSAVNHVRFISSSIWFCATGHGSLLLVLVSPF